MLLKAKTMDLGTANVISFQKYVYISYNIDRIRKCNIIPEGMAQFSSNFCKVSNLKKKVSRCDIKKLQALQCGYLSYKITGLPAVALMKIACVKLQKGKLLNISTDKLTKMPKFAKKGAADLTRVFPQNQNLSSER